MNIKCSNRDCENSQSTDDNNFRGVQQLGVLPDGRTDPNKRIGPESYYCYKCGAEASREVVEADAILPSPPSRPLKRGDATNLPDDNFDYSEEKEKE